MSKLHELAELGQAIWLDYIRRAFITSGKFKDLIDLGVRGMTSNPTIFEKAITGSQISAGNQPGEYDADIERLSISGKNPQEIFEALTIEDIQLAADMLRPTYDATHGGDGYVSIEVNPTLAHQTQATLDEAERLWSRVNRPNLMVKIPATKEGLPAITDATADGINVNITLIFSLLRYQEVMEAFIKGLELRLASGKPIDHIASVASFFVSRVDTKVDQQLENIIHEEGPRAELAASLRGKAAVANAKLAYSLFQDFFGSDRFNSLRLRGASPQRPLWASTSTKNPSYSDILYIQELIGLQTVNTAPENTMNAFLDHGEVRQTVTEGLEQARLQIDQLESLGVSMSRVTQELEDEGVDAFTKSYQTLIASIDKRRKELLVKRKDVRFDLGSYQSVVDAALDEMKRADLISRIWRGDHTVWKPGLNEITNRLGWLTIYEEMQSRLPQLEAITYTALNAGYTQALVLGMGGSSLAPDLFSKTFGSFSPHSSLRLSVLDSTDPGAVLSHAEHLDPAKTLFIVSTKSGTTEETLSFFKYFYNWTMNALGEKGTGDHFIAITDPGSKLAELAQTFHFRATFLNNPDIGGRYSALSYFGLVPAALAGVDLTMLLDRAAQVAANCKPKMDIGENIAARLGAALGELAKIGRDKVTFFLSLPIASYGDWVEQLIAESTGKEGRGILPVVGELPGSPESYGNDRVFVHLILEGDSTFADEVAALEAAGHPIIRFTLKDRYDIGGQFFLWEMATAIAGHRLGIQPFDQPNVEAAKILARQKVAAFKQSGHLPDTPAALQDDGIAVYGETLAHTSNGALTEFIHHARPGDYIALQAFLQPITATEKALQKLRERLRQSTRLATTLGFGPRFLHSTGQLHKGDAGKGLFIQITGDDRKDTPIPDKAGLPESSITFGILKMAQALGDYQALSDAGRRVIRFHLHGDIAEKIEKLAGALKV